MAAGHARGRKRRGEPASLVPLRGASGGEGRPAGQTAPGGGHSLVGTAGARFGLCLPAGGPGALGVALSPRNYHCRFTRFATSSVTRGCTWDGSIIGRCEEQVGFSKPVHALRMAYCPATLTARRRHTSYGEACRFTPDFTSKNLLSHAGVALHQSRRDILAALAQTGICAKCFGRPATRQHPQPPSAVFLSPTTSSSTAK